MTSWTVRSWTCHEVIDLSWQQPKNPLVDNSGKGCCQAEEGDLSGSVGPGLHEAADRYREARSAAASAIAEAKTQVWEELGYGEGQTAERVRKGKQGLAQAVLGQGGELLTQTGDISER